jgi:ureidoglycolate lyase
MSSKKAPETRTIRLETLSRQAFSPFGDTLSPDGLDPLPIALYGDRIDAWCPALLESDQPMEYLITRSKIREFRVVYVERHLQLTQTFIPLGGCAFISVVARPDAREEGGIPALG